MNGVPMNGMQQMNGVPMNGMQQMNGMPPFQMMPNMYPQTPYMPM